MVMRETLLDIYPQIKDVRVPKWMEKRIKKYTKEAFKKAFPDICTDKKESHRDMAPYDM